MSLASYTPERVALQIQEENTLLLRGVSLSDLSVLIREHMPDLDLIADTVMAAESWQDINIGDIAQMIVSQMPGLAANLIALSAEEPAQADVVQLLPFPTQIDAVLKIAELTFKDVGGIKKSMGVIAGLLKQTKTIEKIKSLKQKTNPQ